MKKQYATPTIKTIKVRLENRILDASKGVLSVTNEENTGAYDAKEDMNFGW